MSTDATKPPADGPGEEPETDEGPTLVRVLILTHDRFQDRRTGVQFNPTTVRNEDGLVQIGAADVPVDMAAEFYANHPSFRVMGELGAPAPKPRVVTAPVGRSKAEAKAAKLAEAKAGKKAKSKRGGHA